MAWSLSDRQLTLKQAPKITALVAGLALATTGITPVAWQACLAAEPVIAYRNGGSGAYPDADPVWSKNSSARISSENQPSSVPFPAQD